MTFGSFWRRFRPGTDRFRRQFAVPAPPAALAVEQFGVAPSTTTMAATALRQALETLVMETALRLHYEEHPDAKPTLGEVALALAAQDGSPLASRPDLIAAAADAVTARRPDADADDVLLWAEAQHAVVA